MKNNLSNPNSFSGNEHRKGKHFQAQMKRVFAAFYSQPKTMLMVSIETGILRANICRYVAKWHKQNRIAMVRKGICPISKHRAGFYTTNKNYWNGRS
ncbi:MAG: hypothetical protein PHI03_04580 [Bacteroidales bacterium]|nr:hypothetical protein [Bacteroidales bacterium]